ncbi:MAG: glycoside hydrolase family 88 protein [Planctomycetaceae bacterium]|nr:glycoside hydrolase family 88 protein [Planctomycetaceae bacterium]
MCNHAAWRITPAFMIVFVSVCFSQEIQVNVDWAKFLSRSDLIWTQMPSGWNDGAFVGNGIIGTVFWQKDKGLYFEVSRTDAYDHRNSSSIYTGRCRMPHGNFLLRYKGQNPQGQMRLDLWNAETRGAVRTDRGAIAIRALTHAAEEIILLDVLTEGSETFDLQWQPDICQTSRPDEQGKKNTRPYPPQVRETIDGVTVSVQEMPESVEFDTEGRGPGQYVTAWKTVDSGKDMYRVYISTTHSWPGTTAKQQAIDNVKRAAGTDINRFVQTHRDWWHDFYQKSFLSLPNSRFESFYWIQMYKMASATRGDRPILDLAGPWYLRGTKWPGIWWNLNIQCAYAPFYASNHNDLANSMIDWMLKYKDNLEKNAQGNGRCAIGRSSPITLERSCPTSNYEVGNLGYALHNVWQQYRATMDDALLREKLYPLLKGHWRFFMDYYVEKGADGKYHLKPSGSPEYTREGYPPPRDCNYNLSIFKWMMGAMVYANDRLKLNDPAIAEVKTVLTSLAAYPVDPRQGFMVGAEQPFAYSHRHWSHMFMVYPFYEYTYDDAAQGELIDRSLAHWLSYSEAFRGYSWLAAASMQAMKGQGNKALESILKSLDHEKFPAQPNTFYIEGSPVIETPLLAARSLQDMILTSYGDTIRVFPAVPTDWKDAAFHNMRAEGAFLVSAVRQDGQTAFIRIESLAGEPCSVKTDMSGQIKAAGTRAFKLSDAGKGVTRIDLAKGETAILYTGTLSELNIAAVNVSDAENYWGTITNKAKGNILPPGTVPQEDAAATAVPQARLNYRPGEQPPFWSVATAETVMARWPDYRQAYWNAWTYVNGHTLYGFEMLYKATGDKRYFDYTKKYIDSLVDQNGNFLDAATSRGKTQKIAFTNLDNMMTGNTLVMLYEQTNDKRYKKAADTIFKAFEGYPRNNDGGFWHAHGMPGQMWIDGIFMGQMFLTRYGKSIGQADYAWDESTRQISVYAKRAQAGDSGLYLHGIYEPGHGQKAARWADPRTGLSPEVWSEGLGWYALVIVETLAVLPQDHPNRTAIEDVYRRLAAGLKRTQDPQSGRWFQVVDKGDRPDNWTDTSGSAMFTYAVAKGIELGLLQKSDYAGVVEKGYRGIVDNARINDKGLVDIYSACDGLGVQADYAKYINYKKMINAKEAVAGFLWATAIVEKPKLEKLHK